MKEWITLYFVSTPQQITTLHSSTKQVYFGSAWREPTRTRYINLHNSLNNCLLMGKNSWQSSTRVNCPCGNLWRVHLRSRSEHITMWVFDGCLKRLSTTLDQNLSRIQMRVTEQRNKHTTRTWAGRSTTLERSLNVSALCQLGWGIRYTNSRTQIYQAS